MTDLFHSSETWSGVFATSVSAVGLGIIGPGITVPGFICTYSMVGIIAIVVHYFILSKVKTNEKGINQ